MINSEEEKQETYTKTLKCTNCGQKQAHKIPKGEMIREYTRLTKCARCGCSDTLVVSTNDYDSFSI